MPKISVIVPIYGVEKYLREAVDSILNQTLTDLEILLIDDGSKDNCPQIIDEYAAKDSRIIAIHKENGGYGQSMNVGLERATGEYIAILEPDDYIDSEMYEDLYSIAKQYNSDIVKSCFYDNLQTEKITRISRMGWIDYIPENKSFTINEYPYFLYYHPSVWSAIYKKEFINKNNIRFIEAPGAGWTDNPFQVQTMCLAERINYTSKSYYYWRRLNENGIDDLKDYTIPIKRSNEIHDWLIKNKISNKKVLQCIFCRELEYLSMILQINNVDNNLKYSKDIINLCKRIDSNLIINNTNVPKRLQVIYKNCLNNPLKFRKKLNNKKYFRFHFNKNSMILILFGKTIIRRENES